jgi:Cu2+-exporting ATPase
MFRDRFWITLALTIPTLVWSDMIQEWFGFRAPAFRGSEYIPAVLEPPFICTGAGYSLREVSASCAIGYPE